MLNNNFLIGTFTSEIYNLYKHLPYVRLFESKVFTYLRIIT